MTVEHSAHAQWWRQTKTKPKGECIMRRITEEKNRGRNQETMSVNLK